MIVCNDAGERGSVLEKILRLKRANIVYFDGKSNWKVLDSEIGMAAGLNFRDGKLFVSAALEDKIYSYSFDNAALSGKKLLTEIKGPDNLRFYNNTLLTSAHTNINAFIRHTGSAEKQCPGTSYIINPLNGNTKLLFYNAGEIISAASTSLILDGKLYVSQIFEPWIIEMDISGI